MSSKRWCTFLLILWTIANGPSPVTGSGRGEDVALVQDVTVTEVVDGGNKNSSSRSDNGLRKSTGSVSDIVILKSSRLGGEQTFSRVRRIKRETSTGFLKVHLSGGSYVYRPVASVKAEVAQNVSRELTRIARAFADNKKGGYPSSKPKGYGYAKPTPPAPEARITTEENDSQGLSPARPQGASPFVTAQTTTTTTEDPRDIRDNIPGEPGKDYQALASIPKTTFSCEGRAPGFYADVEAGCQVFHRCTDDPWYTGQVRVIMDSFLCPNGSLFNQQIFACDWWGNTDCKSSQEFFELNQQIGQLEETDAGTVQYVKFTGIRVPSAPGTKKVAPGIVPKSERKPLPAEYKPKKTSKENGRPLESDSASDDDLEREYLSGQLGSDEFRPLSADIESFEEEQKGSSQTVDEVKVKKSKKKSKKAKTTTTTPAPIESSEEESSEETQEPSAATNSQSRPFVVNKPNDENTEAQTPAENLLPPEPSFDGDPVTRDDNDGERRRNRDEPESSTRSSRPQNATPRQDYLPPKEYLPPKDTGYNYKKPDNPLKLPDPTYLPPNQNGQYLSGTSPSSNLYLPPTTQRPDPRNTYSSPGGLHTYSPEADSYYRKPSSGYGTPSRDSYLPPPSREYLPGSDPQKPSREYGEPRDSYLPPSRPNQNQPSGYNPPSQTYGQPDNNYLPPKNGPSREYLPSPQKPSNEYGGPSREYGNPNQQNPPSQTYGGPSREYLPGRDPPRDSYQAPGRPVDNTYLPPQKPSNEYGGPSREYGNPNRDPNSPSREYLPGPQKPSNEYGGPSREYGNPNRDSYQPNPPSQTYGQPNQPPSQTYGQPNQPPSQTYGQPNQPPSQSYGGPSPNQPPSQTYGQPNSNDNSYPKPEYLPKIQPPPYNYATGPGGSGYTFFPHQTTVTTVTEHWPASANKFQFDGASLFDTSAPGFVYGAPPPTPGSHYDGTTRNPYSNTQYSYPPPSSGYESQQQRPPNSYSPEKPRDTYGTPQNSNSARPSSDYLPPNSNPARPSSDYGLPGSNPQRPSSDYGLPGSSPQRPSSDYGLPNSNPARPSSDYGLPGSSPQRPSSDYGLPGSNPPRPNSDYLPPNSNPARPNSDYLPPNSNNPPRPSNTYLPSKPETQYLPPSPDGYPGRDQGYTTQVSQPPTQQYGPPTGYSTLPDHILKDYNPSASPTPPTSYSTIPEQTPPPIFDSGQSTGPSGLYTIQAPKIDIVPVPLVSYHSHVIANPIIEFPPFKKR